MTCRKMIRMSASICIIHALASPLCFRAIAQQERGQEEVRVARHLDGETWVVEYDFPGSPDSTYEVTLLLVNERNPSRIIEPRTLSGDIGKGRYANGKRTIRWNFLEDFPDGALPDEGEYRFRVIVEAVGEKFWEKWWVWTAGGLVVAGGALAILLPGRGGNGNGQTPLPDPPTDRPTP